MHNRYHSKGIAKERYFVTKAKDSGLIAYRSAASRSPIDVTIIDTELRTITFIQCKPDSATESSKERLRQENSKLNGSFFCKFEVR